MANGKLIIDRVTWDKMDKENRDCIVYSTLLSIDQRLSRLENKKFISRAYSFVGGVVGGILAVVGYIGIRYFK